MTNYLASTLRDYLQKSSRTNHELERSANLPNASLANMLRGSHPRPSSMSALLLAVPRSEVKALLLAYLRDDCPDDWEQLIEIVLLDDGRVSEEPAHSGPTQPTDIESALIRLRAACQGDIELRHWVIDTLTLLDI